MIFRTLNSVYEIDQAAKRIRRLSGEQSPTQRQGHDGDWREYQELATPLEIGRCLTVVWAVQDGIAKATRTSIIQHIESEAVAA